MAQIFELNPCLIALDKLRPTSWFPKSIGGLGKAEKAIKLCRDSNCAQPDAAISVKFGEQAKFEVLDARTTSLTSFFELSNRAT